LHSAELAVLRMSCECGGQESQNLLQWPSLSHSLCNPHMVAGFGLKLPRNAPSMYWYMLPSQKNSSLTQLVYAYEGAKAVVEKGFEGHFKSSDIKGDSITLSIEHAFLNDSGTYYCAESKHSGEAAEGAEHKLVPAQTGAAFHLMGAA
uniref:Immunoglobulin V-set domain-containing protein n=1 Tax=Cyanoderma ruficeps TaxID=181631 RepID=A0A8C3QZV4_9PASS